MFVSLQADIGRFLAEHAAFLEGVGGVIRTPIAQSLDRLLMKTAGGCPNNQTWQEIEARVRQDRFPTRTVPKQPPNKAFEPDMLTEADCQRLTGLVERMAGSKRRPWQDHRWVFPYRPHLLHQN